MPQSREQIMAIQRELAAAGFDPGPIDGIIGPRTEAAMRARMQSQQPPAPLPNARPAMPGDPQPAPLPRARPPMPGDPQPPPLPRPRPSPEIRSQAMPLPMPREALGTAGTGSAGIQAPPMASAPLGAPVPIPQPGGAGRQYGAPPAPAPMPLQPGQPAPLPSIGAPAGAQVGQPMLPPGGRQYTGPQVQGIESFLANPQAPWPSAPPPLNMPSPSPQTGNVVLPRPMEQRHGDFDQWANAAMAAGPGQAGPPMTNVGGPNRSQYYGAAPAVPPDLAVRAAAFRQQAPADAQAHMLAQLPPQAQALIEMLMSNPRTANMLTPDLVQALIERLSGNLQ